LAIFTSPPAFAKETKKQVITQEQATVIKTLEATKESINAIQNTLNPVIDNLSKLVEFCKNNPKSKRCAR